MSGLLPAGDAAPTLSREDRLRKELAGVIRWHEQNQPRSQQKALGPSQIGHPCARRLVYSIVDAPTCNPGFDPLPAAIGSAFHARLEAHFEAENKRLGRRRWLTETSVEPWPGLTGSADLFDTDTGRVIDWKILGDSSYKRTKLNGPTVSYQRQAQLYGRGFERAGYQVNEVAIVVIPKAGTLSGTVPWVADYDPAVAAEVEARWHQLVLMTDVLDVEHHRERITSFETADEACAFCPFFDRSPAGDPNKCPGHQALQKGA